MYIVSIHLQNIQILNMSRIYGTIKSLSQYIEEFLQTPKGKEVLMEYIIEQDAFNYELINEIKNYETLDKNNNR